MPDEISPQRVTRGYKQLVAEAEKAVETVSIEEAMLLQRDANVQFIDLRDPRELEREGKMPGAFHCPRGMLEFWIDPESPYAKPIFQQAKKYVFFCAGGWRSALSAKTAQEMGLRPVAHVAGGFGAWKKAGGAVEMGETK